MKIEDYNKYYIQGSDHYLIPKDEFKELFNEMINWKEENQKQKEVIDKINNFCKDDKNFEILDLYSQDIVDGIQTNLLDILKEGKNE